MSAIAQQRADAIQVKDASDLTAILLTAVEMGVSDIHISVNEPPMYRLHGSVKPLAAPALTKEKVHMMIYDVLTDDQRRILERDRELDFALSFGAVARFRVNCFYTMNGEAAVFRVIPTKILTMEELKMPTVFRAIAEKPRGLVLVTGPTGSGKSTTLAAIIDYINKTRDDHILTIEDPIEFVHPHRRCVVNQREVGPNTKSFAAALRSALREDPDVILVGEMRDLETISLAISAAETGHLVFGTLHTQSAPKTCDRIIDVFPPEQQKLVRIMFAESFQAICCQQLFKRKDGNGRVCAMEIMLGTSATRSLVREGKTHQLPTIIQTSGRLGMKSLDQDIKDLYNKGVISQDEALRKANNPNYIMPNGEEMLERLQLAINPNASPEEQDRPSRPSRPSSPSNQFTPPPTAAQRRAGATGQPQQGASAPQRPPQQQQPPQGQPPQRPGGPAPGKRPAFPFMPKKN